MNFANESQMQAHLVKWFSEQFPQYYGCLFKVNNEAKNAAMQIATGLISGVSDLVLFANGSFAGIELKHKGAKHSKQHIETQKRWGATIVKHGGKYIMSDDIDELKRFICEFLSE